MHARANIRLAKDSDIGKIVEFNRAMASETEGVELSKATLEKGVSAVLSDEQKGFYLVAEVSGSLKACLLITYEWSDWRNGFFWWIQSVYVARAEREQGLYKQLYQHVKKLVLKNEDVVGIRLYVDSNNQTAQAVYHRLGMLKTEYRLFEFTKQ